MYGIEMWGLSEVWKELDMVNSGFCKRWMGVLNCATNGLAEVKVGRESKRCKCIGQTVQYWYQIMSLAIEDLAEQCYEWQKSNMITRSLTMEFKDKLDNTGLAFEWRKQQQCNFREITTIDVMILKDKIF
jgi:hypothetical protein